MGIFWKHCKCSGNKLLSYCGRLQFFECFLLLTFWHLRHSRHSRHHHYHSQLTHYINLSLLFRLYTSTRLISLLYFVSLLWMDTVEIKYSILFYSILLYLFVINCHYHYYHYHRRRFVSVFIVVGSLLFPRPLTRLCEVYMIKIISVSRRSWVRIPLGPQNYFWALFVTA